MPGMCHHSQQAAAANRRIFVRHGVVMTHDMTQPLMVRNQAKLDQCCVDEVKTQQKATLEYIEDLIAERDKLRRQRMQAVENYDEMVIDRDRWRKIADGLAMEAKRAAITHYALTGVHLSFGLALDAYDAAKEEEK
jgi:hypothetical protein